MNFDIFGAYRSSTSFSFCNDFILLFNIKLNFCLYRCLYYSSDILINKLNFQKRFLKITFFLDKELKAVFGEMVIQGTLFIFIRIFFFIVINNFIGLFPYVFTRRRHISFTLALALPLRLGSILMSVIYQYNNLLAHLVPVGTPRFLMPVMVVIETVSNIIRPLTLSIRLAANIVAGHLLLTLLGSQGPTLGYISLIALILGLFLLLLLEVAVACIQSYVFTILRSLYLNELIRNKFNKFMLG